LFDGFPRTIAQAEAMKSAGAILDFVLEIDVADSEIIERMGGRHVRPASGRSYHIAFNPPKLEGRDDATGELLIQRDDDSEETVMRRLEICHSQTQPLIEYCRKWFDTGDAKAPKCCKIAGAEEINQVRQAAFEALNGSAVRAKGHRNDAKTIGNQLPCVAMNPGQGADLCAKSALARMAPRATSP
jgi:adenylate kinase